MLTRQIAGLLFEVYSPSVLRLAGDLDVWVVYTGENQWILRAGEDHFRFSSRKASISALSRSVGSAIGG